MRTSDQVRSILRSKGTAVYSLPPEATVFEAIQVMSQRSAGALVVIGADQKMVGIVSERDYARKVILCGRSSHEIYIRDIMSSPVMSVSPNETVDECMRIMTLNRIRHLPVVENERVTGVISIGDLVKWIITVQEEKIQQLESFITGAYPG